MSVISRTKGSREGIWAEILSSQSEGTGEYNSECDIYKGEQMIGYLTDDDDLLCIRGEFDYKETGEYEKLEGMEDVPELVDNALHLSGEDLSIITKIIEHWVSEGEDHEDMWEEV